MQGAIMEMPTCLSPTQQCKGMQGDVRGCRGVQGDIRGYKGCKGMQGGAKGCKEDVCQAQCITCTGQECRTDGPMVRTETK